MFHKKKDHNRKLLKYLNTPNRKISFEQEHDNEVSFLDNSITIFGNELQTSLFTGIHSMVYTLTLTASKYVQKKV